MAGKLVELFVGRFTGDKSGVITIPANTRVYVHRDSFRAQPPVNFDVQSAGELVLPIFTVLSSSRYPALNVNGRVYGLEELRISQQTRVIFSAGGQSSCMRCNVIALSQFVSKYWLTRLQIMKGAQLEIRSGSFDVTAKSVSLHIQQTELDYTGSLKADVITIFTDFLSLEYDSTIDTSGRGWPVGQGPGARSCCTKFGLSTCGAGHGGQGGNGCSRACRTWKVDCQTSSGLKTFFIKVKIVTNIQFNLKER